MLPSLRRLAALVLLAGALVVLGPAPAQAACVCQSRTIAQHAKAADAVFVGSVEGAPTRQGRWATYDLEVDRVYKSGLSSETVELLAPSGKGTCGLAGLPRGEPVVFFAVRGGTAAPAPGDEAEWTADRCGGTAAASGALLRRVEELYGEGRTPVPPPPDEAHFTRVADEAPASFTRTAAPGLALVIVGLLGMLLVRRLGR